MPLIECKSPEEKDALKELESRLKNDITPLMADDDTLYYRFLKARDFDVDKAEKMMRKHLTWRKVYQTETLIQDFKPKQSFTEYIEPSHIGFSKGGDVVIYSAAGKLNINEIFKSLTLNDFVKHFVWTVEKAAASSLEYNTQRGLNGYQAVVIMDLDKLSFATATNKLSYNLMLEVTNTLQDNFPERLKAVFVINAPSYYVFGYAVLKAVMSHAMIKKINILGSSGWKEKLLELIDADELPAFLGGNKTDPNGSPFCESFVSFAGKIPDEYFLTHDERYFSDDMEVKKVIVPVSEKKEIFVDINKVNSSIQWAFMVKGKDIGFGLCFQDCEDLQEVIPVQKYDTSEGTERGFYRCPIIGRYVIIFDNSYSWFSSKEVEYCVTVQKPEL